MTLKSSREGASRLSTGTELGGPCCPRRRALSRAGLERLYSAFNRRSCVYPDPVGFLYEFEDTRDREIVALIASCLAYGRVEQIRTSIARVLACMKPTPRCFLRQSTQESLKNAFGQFRHRFTDGAELAALLFGIRAILACHGSLEACFSEGMARKDETILPSLARFAAELRRASGITDSMLLPDPGAGSALKRLNLFMRWMVRQDRVDPGGWKEVSASELIVPLDTHMHRISLAVGLTRRRQPDMRTALEVTEAFRSVAPEDPVRYDFALTRLSMLEQRQRGLGPLSRPLFRGAAAVLTGRGDQEAGAGSAPRRACRTAAPAHKEVGQ
jgi:uncharacterized protein (TIGR02757 family)